MRNVYVSLSKATFSAAMPALPKRSTTFSSTPHEAPQLVVRIPVSPRRLLLQRAEGAEVPFRLHDLLDRGGSECADQLVLQVGVADVEPERLHAEDGTIEAVEDPSHRFAFGVLWHPEEGEDLRLFEELVRAAAR